MEMGVHLRCQRFLLTVGMEAEMEDLDPVMCLLLGFSAVAAVSNDVKPI
jgi:hypothetical protein